MYTIGKTANTMNLSNQTLVDSIRPYKILHCAFQKIHLCIKLRAYFGWFKLPTFRRSLRVSTVGCLKGHRGPLRRTKDPRKLQRPRLHVVSSLEHNWPTCWCADQSIQLSEDMNSHRVLRRRKAYRTEKINNKTQKI